MIIRCARSGHASYVSGRSVEFPGAPGLGVQHLSSCGTDAAAISNLRLLLYEAAPQLDILRLTDDDVLEMVEEFLWAGDLRTDLPPEPEKRESGGPAPVAAAAAAPPPPASQASQPADEPEPDTFHPDLDGRLQAAALMSAAAQGVPFCET